MDRIPDKLGQDTIIEAVFELRFLSTKDSVADILPGLLYQHVSESFPKIERLGITQLPLSLIQSEASFRYAPHYKLIGDHYSMQVGEHVFSINCPRPYGGWDEFKSKIHELVDILRGTDIIETVERFSVKYVNVIPMQNDASLDQLKVSLTAGPFDLGKQATLLRTEVIEDGFLNIVQISTQVSTTLKDSEVVEGVLLDIDTICQRDFSNFWDEFDGLLEQAHNVEKKIFFGLLKESTIDNLDPQWEGVS